MSASALFLSGQMLSEAPKVSSQGISLNEVSSLIDMVFAQHNIGSWVHSNRVQIAGAYKRTKAENWEQFLDKIGTREVHNSEPVKLSLY